MGLVSEAGASAGAATSVSGGAVSGTAARWRDGLPRWPWASPPPPLERRGCRGSESSRRPGGSRRGVGRCRGGDAGEIGTDHAGATRSEVRAAVAATLISVSPRGDPQEEGRGNWAGFVHAVISYNRAHPNAKQR